MTVLQFIEHRGHSRVVLGQRFANAGRQARIVDQFA
jgi:hypothetical protein